MKKVFLVAAFAVLGVMGANAQGFKVGVNVGYPIGDVGEFYSFQAALDVAYTWEVSDSFSAGLTTGYGMFFGGEEQTIDTGFGTVTIEALDFSYVPVAATAAYSVSENWFIGADLGYAVNVSEGDGEGGFLYQPEFGYQTEMIELYAFYKGISLDGGSISSIGVGFAYKFGM